MIKVGFEFIINQMLDSHIPAFTSQVPPYPAKSMFSAENNILKFVRQFCDYDFLKVSKRNSSRNPKNTGSRRAKVLMLNSDLVLCPRTESTHACTC